MKLRIVVPALLAAAMFVSPASANWFSNPTQNVNRYVGSAPNPKPQDIRENRQPVVVQEEKSAEKKVGFMTRLLGPAPGSKKEKDQDVAQAR